MIFAKCGLTLIFLILCTSIFATNRYVAKNGNNSNEGTQKMPYFTIQKGLDAAFLGDTVFVMSGTYPEYVTFNRSGSVGRPIVLKNYSNDNVIIDAENKRAYCIYATDKSNIVVDGINICRSTAYNIKFNGCTNATAKNLTSTLAISNNYGADGSFNVQIAPSSTNWSKNITLDNVSTVGGQYGLLVSNKTDGLTLIEGKYSYASIDGINMQGYDMNDSTTFNRNIILDGTEVDNNLRQGVVTMGLIHATFKNFWAHDNKASGVQIENNSSYIEIENFICENNSKGWQYEAGLWIDDSDSVTVRRGIMRNNQCGFRVSNSKNVLAYNLLIYSNNFTAKPTVNNSAGICFYSMPLTPPTNYLYESHVELYNSTLFNNSNIYSQRGSVDIEGDGTYILKNNIISNDQSQFDIYRTGTNRVISDYNLIYNTRALNVYYKIYAKSKYIGQKSWSAYKFYSGQDIHTINADPLFIDSANGNFNLQSKSPAINAGTNVGLHTNDLIHPIDNKPNIGAY